MKIFFQGSYQGSKDFGKYYKIIYLEIEKLGYKHLDLDSVHISYGDFLHKMKKGKEAYTEHYEKKIKALKEADICIFETSIHSLGVGFLIQKAIEYDKPVIVLYYGNRIPFFLSGINDEKFVIKSYNIKNIKQVLVEALAFAKERRDKRFNFFISPKLLGYIEKVSKEKGITKSQFIRDLIIQHLKKSSV